MGTYFRHVKGKGTETSTLNQICYRQLYKDGHAMGEETQTWIILWCLWPPSHCKCLLWSSSEPLSLLFSLRECNSWWWHFFTCLPPLCLCFQYFLFFISSLSWPVLSDFELRSFLNLLWDFIAITFGPQSSQLSSIIASIPQNPQEVVNSTNAFCYPFSHLNITMNSAGTKQCLPNKSTWFKGHHVDQIFCLL